MNRWSEIGPYLHAAEEKLATFVPSDPTQSQGWDETNVRLMRGEVVAMRAMSEGNSGGDTAKSIELCQQALAQLPEDSAVVRGIILMTMGRRLRGVGQPGTGQPGSGRGC